MFTALANSLRRVPRVSEEAFEDLQHGDVDIASVVRGITDGRMSGLSLIHLDPDLNFDAYRHRKDRADWQQWRGMLGQAGIAQSHLNKQGVGSGDVFLFFGLYRRVEETAQGWRFVRGAPDLHVLWGWLQVDKKHLVADIGPNELAWARHHPHISRDYRDGKNTVYAASKKLDLGGDDDRCEIAGWGAFPKLDQRLVLTNPNGAGLSNWRLPRWFYPDGNKPPLTVRRQCGTLSPDTANTMTQTDLWADIIKEVIGSRETIQAFLQTAQYSLQRSDHRMITHLFDSLRRRSERIPNPWWEPMGGIFYNTATRQFTYDMNEVQDALYKRAVNIAKARAILGRFPVFDTKVLDGSWTYRIAAAMEPPSHVLAFYRRPKWWRWP